ncbi:MAG: SDR family oxidoreductase [Ktedonobacteraceae bacterium]|nr:SDR family oxidoreductase [Ktedonobacteraceae bacterium]
MFTYQGKTALITGASSGIGEAFVRALAGRGMHVMLVARSEEKLRALAAEMSGQHEVRAEVIAADLGQEQAVQLIQQEVERRGLTIDLLVNNAGFGTYGLFETISPEREHQEVMVNIAAMVALTHAFVPPMVARGQGAVINLSSVAGFQPLPYMAVYAATKAFVLSFSEALSVEYRRHGVRVLALCPGVTDTAFLKEASAEPLIVAPKRTPEQAVATGLRALERGRSVVIDGVGNAMLPQVVRLFPRALIAQIAGQVMRPRGAGMSGQAAATQKR